MKIFILSFLLTFNVFADCYKTPFFVAGAQALKRGSCQGIAWSAPAFLVSYCKRKNDYDLKAALQHNCFSNRYLCQNQDKIGEESFWSEVLSNSSMRAIYKKFRGPGARGGQEIDKMNLRDSIEALSALVVFKAKDVMMAKMTDLASANMDAMEATSKLYSENEQACEEVIKSIRTEATALLNSKFEILKEKFDSSTLKSGVCQLVSWTCQLKTKDFKKETSEPAKKEGEVDLTDPLR